MNARGDNRRTRQLGDQPRPASPQRGSNPNGAGRDARAFDEARYRDRSSAAYRETARQREYSPTPESSDSYSVSLSGARYAAAGKRQRKKRRIVVASAVAAVLVAVIAGSALGLFSGINAALRSGLDVNLFSTLTKVAAGDPFYVLLMGTDESTDRQEDEEFGGVFRTDTIILARVDPREQGLTLVSIPRDTMVDLGKYGEQKINAAHAFGGSVLAVQAVEELTGVKISHYVEIDFDGFIGLVDALGGVEVDVPMTIDDIDAGGHVDAGLHTLNSWEALTLCRARNAYEEVVGQGDLYRAANQRLVLAAIMKKILASDPATMTSAINSCAQYVRTDMSVGDILGLAESFRGFDSEKKLYTAVFPVESAYIDEIWWDIPQMDEWKDMRTRMEQGLSPSTEDVVDPVTGTVLATAGDSAQPGGSGSSSSSPTHHGFVVVRNGSTHDGAGANAAEKLEDMGFTTDVDNADADDYPTTLVVYEEASQQAEARQIADTLGCSTVFQNDGSYYFEGDYLVVIGADWRA